MQLEKRFPNESGDILVKQSNNSDPGIVEILHLWNNNDSGGTIGYWETRECDGETIAEFLVHHNSFLEVEYDEDDLPMQVLKFGQKLADLIIELKK